MNTQILKNKLQNDEILNNLASFFINSERNGVKIYLVGGSVRDFLLEKNTYDRDLIVEGIEAKNFAQEVAEFFGATFITLDEVNKIYRVVMPDKTNYLDITQPIGGNLQNDLFRRDLTINAIAADIKTGELIDFTGGIKDLSKKIIRGIKEANFTEDPLRLLRIFRFYSILGFEIDNSLMNIAQKHKSLIHNPASERIIYELLKLFDGEYAHSALLKMDECGLLEEVFPFVKELKQVPPNLHHHLNLFDHSIETVKQLNKLYKNSQPEIKKHLESVDFGGSSRIAHLRLAAFMHDIGKFSTWTIEPETGRHRFLTHEDAGSRIAKQLLKSMKFSNKQIDYITYIIKKHMYPTGVVSSPNLNEKVMMRYLRKSQENAIDTILIAQADRLSARGPLITEELVNENISNLNKLLSFCIDSRKNLEPLPKLLDGNEVMKLLNIKPSPQLGKILEELYEAQVSGDITTKDQAIEYIKTIQL